MRLTKLRLNGFKSFVDPTDLIIADGLTGVVGPNGCGKSNLLEAMRWVMGENRPKAMRGGGMDDVIFAGASSRPARNFAEVSLLIDNGERLAPAAFNDTDILEISRRITRDAGSAYKVNTKDARARDVQMLFADASTGAHSPALVRQGQISELINARPKTRRRFLEEAAGISGLYQRRHEAELKLNAAEVNLARVEDVVEQLANQLGQLARQARQAARYRRIGQDLRRSEGVLLYRRWKEAEELNVRAVAELTAQITAASASERNALDTVKRREASDAVLPQLREEEAIAAALNQRLLVQRDTLQDQEDRARQMIETLRGRIDQLTRDLDREEALNKDAGETIERLEWESKELAKAAEGHESRLAQGAAAAGASAGVLQEREVVFGALTEDVARLSARHQSAHRLLEDVTQTRARSEFDAAQAMETVKVAGVALTQVRSNLKAANKAHKIATDDAQTAETNLIAADDRLGEAQSREADARAGRSEAEGEANALRAEVAALERLVQRDTAESGQVLDLVSVATGYEKALGAALADDLRAPVVTNGTDSGWNTLDGYPSPPLLPDGVRGLVNHVSVPDVLARRMAQVGLVDAADGFGLQEALQPGQRLVSVAGDLWRWDGFHANAQDAPSATALRLQQLNRVQELKQDLEEASARAAGAVQAHEVLKKNLSDLSDADRQARDARRLADKTLTEANRVLSRTEADCNISEGKLESLGLAVSRHDEEATRARQSQQEASKAVEELGDLNAARTKIEDIKMTVETARMTMIANRSDHDELRREGEARVRRSQEVTKELSGWRHRLETAGKRVAELENRKQSSAEELVSARATPGDIATKRIVLAHEIETAETRRQQAADALAEGETNARTALGAEREAERTASQAREARAGAMARADAAKQSVSAASERIAEEQDTTPQELLQTLDVVPDQMPDAQAIETEVNRLKRQRDALGAVNLRAEEDAREVQEEHDLLVGEINDLHGAIKALRSGIAGLNKEGRERLLTAFEQVNSNFTTLFKHLFGGGEAKLVLVESDDPLEAGLEIMCQPPGKKLSTLSLLSGGEQTLTALALIFAVFLANPAPICVLDEVDAPLDDANVSRFCDLLDEMTRQTNTRFLIITHHAVTMARMDRLFGVTMAEQGVSQLVSVDLKSAEKMVA